MLLYVTECLTPQKAEERTHFRIANRFCSSESNILEAFHTVHLVFTTAITLSNYHPIIVVLTGNCGNFPPQALLH